MPHSSLLRPSLELQLAVLGRSRLGILQQAKVTFLEGGWCRPSARINNAFLVMSTRPLQVQSSAPTQPSQSKKKSWFSQDGETKSSSQNPRRSYHSATVTKRSSYDGEREEDTLRSSRQAEKIPARTGSASKVGGKNADNNRFRKERFSSSSSSGSAVALPPGATRRGTGGSSVDNVRLRMDTRGMASVPSAPPSLLPVSVPRSDGIQDGPWRAADQLLLKKAESEAQAIVKELPVGAKKETLAAKVLLGRSVEELENLMEEFGEPKYRGRQLHQFIYETRRHDLSTLQQLPKKLRDAMTEQGWRIGRAPVHHIAGAKDGTAKILLRLEDDRLVETVGIPKEGESRMERLTACISSQVGCPLRCSFCATGKGGFARNLRPHEIVDQVLAIEELFGERVSNVVFMGMGEPLLNLPSLLIAHRSLNKDLGIGQRMITISTVGVPNTMARLAERRLQSTLAVSLHAPNQQLRERLVPSARAYPLQALMEDCQSYFKTTGRRVSFEYTLLAGVNDSPAHAAELADLLHQHKLAHHVNAIPYNPVDDSDYKRPSKGAVSAFVDALTSRRVTCSVRQTRGLEANAACGQLRNAFQKSPLPPDDPVNTQVIEDVVA